MLTGSSAYPLSDILVVSTRESLSWVTTIPTVLIRLGSGGLSLYHPVLALEYNQVIVTACPVCKSENELMVPSVNTWILNVTQGSDLLRLWRAMY